MTPGGHVLVVSCYELGHQPLAAGTALAFLERAGARCEGLDLAVTPLDRVDPRLVSGASLIAVSTPMHTALRVGVDAVRVWRRRHPGIPVCFFGHYAWLNADWLLSHVADSVLGGECEDALVELARGGPAPNRRARPLDRLEWLPPARKRLPALDGYARLLHGERSVPAAAVETTRGCLHVCRHCPITPVYGGRFFAVPRDTVLDDIGQVVAAGAGHITFADPDFLNGPTHARRIVERMHRDYPQLTFDFTARIEHLVRHRELLAELATRGCLFVVSAVESLSDRVLERLDKGHTRADVIRAQSYLRGVGIALRPSFVAFTPWTTLADYLELLEWVEGDDLVEHVDPVQWSIRLLVPPGSPLADDPAMTPYLEGLDDAGFTYRWTHPDPAMERLHAEVSRIVQTGTRRGDPAATTHQRICRAARRAAGRDEPAALTGPPPPRLPAPRLSEAWFC